MFFLLRKKNNQLKFSASLKTHFQIWTYNLIIKKLRSISFSNLQIFKLKTVYTDPTGSIETEICNDFQENGNNTGYLTMLLDGVSFKSYSLDDFELQNKENYTPEQLQRFTFNPPIQDKNQSLSLCNCSLQFDIPSILIDLNQKKEIQTLLSVNLQLGMPTPNGGLDFEEADFQITINDQTYKSTGGVFEDGLDSLKKKWLVCTNSKIATAVFMPTIALMALAFFRP